MTRAPQVSELTSGVDALYLSARAVLSPSLCERLEEMRRFADRVRLAVPVELGGEIVPMAPHAWGRYRYCLEHRCFRIGLTSSPHLPQVRVQPRAEALHSLGPKGTVELVSGFLSPELGTLSWSVSRLDLFCDVEGLELCAQDARRFVCRADARRTFELGGVLSGFTFGTRKTKTLSARLYDKTADVAAKGTTWWKALWGDAYTDGVGVWRLEFEVARGALIQFGLSSPKEVLSGAGDIWAHATTDWLSYRTPTKDTTRSRWPLAPEWHVIQGASLLQRRMGAERIAAAQKASSVARLLPGLTGYLASLAALVGTEDLDDTVVAAGPHLRDYERATRTTFADRVVRKRAAMGRP